LTRWAGLAGAAFLALTGCHAQEAAESETSQATGDRIGDALERMRHTPLDSEVATNDEYAIAAVFPKGSPVCILDSGSHIHGFNQWLESDCTKEAPDVRFDRKISIWADYNAAEYSRSEAAALYCPDTSARGVVDTTVPPGVGWTVSCREPRVDDQEEIVVAFFSSASERDRGFGPDRIEFLYTVRLATDAAHRTEDMETFRDFLGQLELAGTRLQVAS
jgi:hypothetical protein